MDWLLLAYKIPREPTAGRVYVWRKLKQLGAIAVQDGGVGAARDARAPASSFNGSRPRSLNWAAMCRSLRRNSACRTAGIAARDTSRAPVQEAYGADSGRPETAQARPGGALEALSAMQVRRLLSMSARRASPPETLGRTGRRAHEMGHMGECRRRSHRLCLADPQAHRPQGEFLFVPVGARRFPKERSRSTFRACGCRITRGTARFTPSCASTSSTIRCCSGLPGSSTKPTRCRRSTSSRSRRGSRPDLRRHPADEPRRPDGTRARSDRV